MRKVLFIGFIATILTFCKSNPTVDLSRKETSKIKGEYTITSVIYPGQDLFKVKSFELADSQCFVGSNWKFIANNNSGNMNMNNSKCDAFESKITWYINKEGKFIFKILNEGVKAKKVKEGYELTVANATDDSFQLVDRINVGGSVNNIVYQFNKVK
ncbi:MAG: hypothetical protein ACOVQ2_08645 [Flavobacterium sp.]|jgi:hypothetical protein